ncbi:MAG: MFS transporter [Flavobacteriales bacterium]|nr:MFS transporter [Flavobacteriales bacterium]
MQTVNDNRPFYAFKFKEFRYFIVTRFFITVAFAIQFLVIEWFVYQQTKNPLDLGLIALAEIIPAILFSLISGHYIDNSEKRNATRNTIFLSVLIAFGFYFLLKYSYLFETQKLIYLIYSLVFIFGIFRAFISPSIFALFSLILPKNAYANGTTWSSSVWQIGAVLGPAIAGFLYAFLGAHNSILVTIVLLVICFGLISLIEKKEIINKQKSTILESLKIGFNFIYKTKVILTALSLDLFAVLFGGAIALLPVFISDEIIPLDSYYDSVNSIYTFFGYTGNVEKIKSLAFGILRSAPAIGAIITMVTIAYIPIKRRTGIKLLVSVLGFGLCIIAFGISKYFWLSFGILVLSGIFDGVSVVIRSTILQILTPDEMRGRVASINTIFVGSSNELGAFESGVTAKLFGTVRAVIGGGLITCGIVLGTYFKTNIKEFELNEDE